MGPVILRRPRRSADTQKLSAAEEYKRSIDPRMDNALGEITSVSGIIITPFDLQPEQVRIIDIAHALSRQCRFVGHCAGFLSVAEHSVRVAAIVEKTNPELALTGLLHDASEAYLGDVARPIKHLDGMAAYREAEQRAEQVISSVYGTVYPLPPEVIDADRQQFVIEMKTDRWNPSMSMRPETAKALFLSEFERLDAGRRRAKRIPF